MVLLLHIVKVSHLYYDCNLLIRAEHFWDLFRHYLLNSKLRPSGHKRERQAVIHNFVTLSLTESYFDYYFSLL